MTSLQSRPRQPRAHEDPLNKVCPSMLASVPASMLNQNSPDLGIPNRIELKTSRFSHDQQQGADWRPAPALEADLASPGHDGFKCSGRGLKRGLVHVRTRKAAPDCRPGSFCGPPHPAPRPEAD